MFGHVGLGRRRDKKITLSGNVKQDMISVPSSCRKGWDDMMHPPIYYSTQRPQHCGLWQDIDGDASEVR